MRHEVVDNPAPAKVYSTEAQYRKLVISPHVDDEALGCGGILDSNTHVHFCGIDESLVASNPGHRIPADEREAELDAVAAFFGFSFEINRSTRVNHYTTTEIIAGVEKAINDFQPDMVLIPYVGGYNQDHKTVFNAAQVALRPHDSNFFVKKVVVYEGIHDLIWSSQPYTPNYFIEIDVERKITGYQIHKSQVRGMRSPEMLRSHARMRGMMAGCEYAEGFMIQRWVS